MACHDLLCACLLNVKEMRFFPVACPSTAPCWLAFALTLTRALCEFQIGVCKSGYLSYFAKSGALPST